MTVHGSCYCGAVRIELPTPPAWDADCDCPVCGCGTHWQTLGEDFGRMGVNARLLDGFDEAAIVWSFDNAG